jgi:hypothetical protein
MKPLSRDAQGLIEMLGKADGPSPERRVAIERRVAAAVGAGVVGLGSAKAAAAGSGALASLGGSGVGAAGSSVAKLGVALTFRALAWWAAAGIGASAVATTAVVAWEHQAPNAPRASVARTIPTRPVVVTSRAQGQKLPEQPSSVPERQPTSEAPPAAETQTHPKPTPPTDSEPWPTRAALAEKMRLLGTAQKKLAAENGEAALEMLVQHERRFPQGVLSEERRAARVLALCSLGRTSEAREEAKRFLQTSPKSPLVPRVTESCASASGPISADR